MSFNGLLSQIKNLMPLLLKEPRVSENRVYEIGNKTKSPRQNINDFDESTSNEHTLFKVHNFNGKGGSENHQCIGHYLALNVHEYNCTFVTFT